MRIRTGVVLLLLLMTLLPGCNENTKRLYEGTVLKPLDNELRARYVGGARHDPEYAALDRKLTQYENAQSEGDRIRLRNEMIGGLMATVDYDYSQYELSLSVGKRVAATASDFAILGLTTAATLTGGEQAKSILSGIAALVTGSRIAVDKEIFYDNALPVLIGRMEKLRSTKRLDILHKLTLNTSEYTLMAGLSDINDYYQQGTLTAAFTDIAQSNTPAGSVNPPAPELAITSIKKADGSNAVGPAAGGTEVVIVGTGFGAGVKVAFDKTDATSISLIAGTNVILATAPAHAAGDVDVVVTNADGKSVTLAKGFKYQ